MEDKLFLGFGLVAIICGILLVLEKNYIIGISGSIVGAGLVLKNIKKIKDKKSSD